MRDGSQEADTPEALTKTRVTSTTSREPSRWEPQGTGQFWSMEQGQGKQGKAQGFQGNGGHRQTHFCVGRSFTDAHVA